MVVRIAGAIFALALILLASYYQAPRQAYAQPAGGADPVHILSAASTNSNLIRAQPSVLYSITAINTSVTLYYLKLYDIAVAPTCASSPVSLTFPVPFGAANAGGGLSVNPAGGWRFFSGVGMCLTGGIADNDNTAAAAGVAIAFGVRG